MPASCNLDRSGRLLRGIGGGISILAGMAWLVMAWPSSWLEWLIVVMLTLGGAFAVTEARFSWCVVRAMGFKTPI